MNSLLLFLFLGVSVALAELPFEHPDFVEFLNEEDHEDIFGELADEENDPRRPRPPIECVKKFRQCIKENRPSRRPFTRPSGRPTRPADEENDPRRHRPSGTPPAFVKECVDKLRQCIKEHRPSGRPFTRPSRRPRPSGRPTRPAEDFLSELADEENDSRRPRPSGTPPAFVKECKEKLGECIKNANDERCARLKCLEEFGKCIKESLPSPRPTLPFTIPPKKKLCLERGKKCYENADDCKEKIRCVICTKFCLKRGRRVPRFCRPRPSGRPSRPFTRPSGRPTRPAE